MRNPLKYTAGDKVGECVFFGNERTEIIARRYRRMATFVCPYCGDNFEGLVDNVKRLVTQSCGCWQKKVSSDVHTIHGKSLSREYRIWIGIKTRCADKDDPDYGGRGIFICERWETSFENFISDMGERPSAAHSVERKDNDLGYDPDNCIWATMKEQLSNKRNNRRVEYNGETKTLMQWSSHINISYSVLQYRLNSSWSIYDAFTTPVDRRNKYKTIKK